MPKLIIECPSCKGTGLYVGMGERGGAAVVCYQCRGKGWTEYLYQDYSGRKVREGVQRVFASSFGYVHGATNFRSSDGGLIRFEEGGCSYQDWLNGAEPKPVKDLYCPYIWDNRGIGNEPIPRCKESRNHIGRISDCEFFFDKENCWKIYELKKRLQDKKGE